MSQSHFSEELLLKEIQHLRTDVQRLELSLSQTSKHKSSTATNLKIFFTATGSERKPFLLKMDGALTTTLKLSSVRASIMLVLLLDLQNRHEDGPGVTDVTDAIIHAYQLLNSNYSEADSQLANSIRVALYRFGNFCKSNNNFAGPIFKLCINPTDHRLSLARNDNTSSAENLSVEISTNDASITAVMNQTLDSSPLSRVRKRKALYVPGGPESYDRLLLELYDHSYTVKVTTTYFRPAIQSYPVSLLEHLGMSEKSLQRKRLVFEAYKSGRCHFQEILNFETIWDLIRFSPESGFKLYPSSVSKAQVAEHLSHLIYKIDTFEAFELVLTEAQFPFYLGTFDILSGTVPEHFTIFFSRLLPEFVHDVSCFVVHDAIVNHSIADNLIKSALTHSSTICDREKVKHHLLTVQEHLLSKGPIKIESS